MINARPSTHDQEGIRTWIAARLSDADGEMGTSDIALKVDDARPPPSGLDGMRQQDLFDAKPIEVRSTPPIIRRKNVSPSDLDGSRGRFRRVREQCLLNAENDYDAIQAWVLTKGVDADRKLTSKAG